MAKRLSWNDWLLFSEKCGMPVILGNTNAQRDTPAWAAMARAIRAIAPKTGLLADTGTTLNAVSMGAGGQNTYRELVDTVDRAISALYRGGDLATQSSGPDAAGVNAQDGESELMDGDGCKMISETLRDQVEKFVIRFELGDFEPLAEIVIDPPADSDDVERDMKIDNHLAALGVRLSKKDALTRYGRTEAEDENDALTPPATPPQGGFGPIANELHPQTALHFDEKALQNAGKRKDGQSPAREETALKSKKNGVLESAIADIIAQTFADELSKASQPPSEDDAPEIVELVNEDVCHSEDPAHCRIHGTPENRQKRCQDALDAYNASTDHPSPDDVISGKVSIETALKKGFEVKFGGQKLIFFTQVIGEHYAGREGRLQMIKHVLEARNNMFPVKHPGDQIGLVERLTQKNSGMRHVVTADRETGIALNVMRCSDEYIKRNYK